MAVHRYAEGTRVTVESSRGEITGILTKHGVKRMGWMADEHGDQLMFELAGGSYRLNIRKPTLDEVRERYIAEGGRWNLVYDEDAKVAAEWRRRWRANVLLLKAKLEFIDSLKAGREMTSSPFSDCVKTMAVAEEILGQALMQGV